MRIEDTTTTVCEQCGVIFQTRARGTLHRFCSRSCARDGEHGELNHNWKGGRYVDPKTGYVSITLPDGRQMREHRYVAEQILGRPLTRDEEPHHINLDRSDNRPENIQVLTRLEHKRLHSSKHGRWSMKYDACVECGTTTTPYNAKGLCRNCYMRKFTALHRVPPVPEGQSHPS